MLLCKHISNGVSASTLPKEEEGALSTIRSSAGGGGRGGGRVRGGGKVCQGRHVEAEEQEEERKQAHTRMM